MERDKPERRDQAGMSSEKQKGHAIGSDKGKKHKHIAQHTIGHKDSRCCTDRLDDNRGYGWRQRPMMFEEVTVGNMALSNAIGGMQVFEFIEIVDSNAEQMQAGKQAAHDDRHQQCRDTESRAAALS